MAEYGRMRLAVGLGYTDSAVRGALVFTNQCVPQIETYSDMANKAIVLEVMARPLL